MNNARQAHPERGNLTGILFASGLTLRRSPNDGRIVYGLLKAERNAVHEANRRWSLIALSAE